MATLTRYTLWYVQDGAFDEAVKGVDGIEHIAWPVHLHADDPQGILLNI